MVEVAETGEGRDGAGDVAKPRSDDSSASGADNAAEPGSDDGSDSGSDDVVRLSSEAVETQKWDSEDDIILSNISPEPEHLFFVGLRNFLLSRHGKQHSA